MRFVYLCSLLALTAGLQGCQFQSPNPQAAAHASGSCDASAVSDLVGKAATPAALDQARVRSGAERARIVRPGEMITQEYNDRRLTLSTDEQLNIQRIRCG